MVDLLLMSVQLHPHAVDRLIERGATEAEVVDTVEQGNRSLRSLEG